MATNHSAPSHSSPAATTQPAKPSHPGIVTPNVTPSDTWRYIVYVFIFIVILGGITIIYLKDPSSGENKELDLSDYGYGEIMSFKVEPNSKKKVNLVYSSYTVIYSSNEIKTFDEYNVKRNQEGTKFTSGPDATASHFYIFRNDSEKSIVVKIVRCKSEKEIEKIKKQF